MSSPTGFIECEQKFLLSAKPTHQEALAEQLREHAGKIYRIRQGYLNPSEIDKVRVRLLQELDPVSLQPVGPMQASLDLKGPPVYADGVKRRAEVPVTVPAEQVGAIEQIFPTLCPQSLCKLRHVVSVPESESAPARRWEFDKFEWGEPALQLFQNKATLAKKYQHLVTADIELPDVGDKIQGIQDFPEWVRQFVVRGKDGDPANITQRNEYKSTNIARINSGFMPSRKPPLHAPTFLERLLEEKQQGGQNMRIR